MKKKKPFILQVLKWLPRKKHLVGSLLHRVIGDRLFDPGVWKMSSGKFGAGLALGTFVAFSPILGFQMVIAGVLCFAFRINLPAALLACWITNPVTIPLIYPLEFQVGSWFNQLIGLSDFIPANVATKFNLRNVTHVVTGSLIFSTFGSLFVYGLFYLLIKVFKVHRVSPKKEKSRE